MAASTYDIYIEQGATFTLSLLWKDSTGSPVNLTGYTAHMQVRQTYSSTTAVLDLSTTNGDIVLGGSAGTIVVTAPADLTTALTIKHGFYDLELTSAGGIVTRLVQGQVTVSPEITKL